MTLQQARQQPHHSPLVPQTPLHHPSPRPVHTVYSSTFTFATKQFDEAFHRLDQEIAAAAKAIPGYLGEETWENPAAGLVSNVYYWESLEALGQLMHHPRHLEAKASQSQWLAGYKVVISQVLRTYGDSGLSHVLPVPPAD